MQTILGSSGVIGQEIARSLPQHTSKIRLVSRDPRKVNPGDEIMKADLLYPDAVTRAVKGSEVVYVTIGFEYDHKIWQQKWPLFIRSVLVACMEHKCKLVFFDNMYMYDDQYLDRMTEKTPINPPSKKGKVRADIYHMIMDKVKEGKVKAVIARCADYYGPGAGKNSALIQTVFDPLSKGKKAKWLGSADRRHSFTYTPDVGKATALLGNTPDAYNQVWHLPTASDPFTGRQWIDNIAGELGVKPGVQVASKGLLKIMGWFNPFMRELSEMVYQFDRDYIFSSRKFEKRFGIHPTPYCDGIREIVKLDYGK